MSVGLPLTPARRKAKKGLMPGNGLEEADPSAATQQVATLHLFRVPTWNHLPNHTAMATPTATG